MAEICVGDIRLIELDGGYIPVKEALAHSLDSLNVCDDIQHPMRTYP